MDAGDKLIEGAGLERQRGRGRPEGSPNKRIPDLVRAISDKYGKLPADVLAEAIFGTEEIHEEYLDRIETLRRENAAKRERGKGFEEVSVPTFMEHRIQSISAHLGIKKADGAKLYTDMIKIMMPYVHPRVTPKKGGEGRPVSLNVLIQSNNQQVTTATGTLGPMDLRPMDIRGDDEDEC